MVNNLVLFLVLIIVSTGTWPVTMWVTQKGGRPEMNGMMNSCVLMILSIIGVVALNKWHEITVEMVLIGIVVGIAYSVGFCIFIYTCIQIGPSGLTSMINSLGLIGAILVGIMFEKPGVRDQILIAVGGVLVAVSLMLITASQGKDTKITKKWLVYVSIGAVFSVLSFMGNAITGKKYPDSILPFGMIAHTVSFLILLTYSRRKKRGRPNRYEILNGVGVGGMSLIGGFVSFRLLKTMSPVIVYPVSTVIPVIVVLFLGYFFLDEKLTKRTLAGSVFGVLGITVLSLYGH